MKRFYILLALSALPLALMAQIESKKQGGQGWEKVADPETSNTRLGAAGQSIVPTRFPHTVVPLADGYTYTSLQAGTFRALSSEIESNPHGVVWTQLDGVPSSGGVSWRALAWALDVSGDVITSFAKEPRGSLVTGCPCGYYRLPKNTTKFVSAGGSPNGVVGYIVSDGKGRLYSDTGFGFTIQRSIDGGKSWGTAPGSFASNPYSRLSHISGGLYGFAVINHEIYTGGEGGILKCDIDMKSCAEVAMPAAQGYKRNVTAFASNGTPLTPATEIFELARQAPPSSKEGGLSLMKWDSTSDSWNYVPAAQGAGPWYEAYVHSIEKLPGPHEYILTRYSRNDSQILYTNDAVTWTPYDLTGLPPFDMTYRPLVLAVNPLTGAKYMVTSGRAADIWVHK